jgi:ribosomal protein L32
MKLKKHDKKHKKVKDQTFLVHLEEDPDTGELILPFPEGFCDEMGWDIGDTLDFTDNKDGTFSINKIEKVETQYVLVECISTFRQRYMVEVPVGTDRYGKDKSLWALDTVTMNEAKEFSQEHIGEQIISHRVVSKEEALTLCDIDNDYCSSWDEETKMKNFFTTWSEQENAN